MTGHEVADSSAEDSLPKIIQVALLEDNKYKLQGIEVDLSREPDIEVALASRDPTEFVDFVIQHEPHVACIDLQLHGDDLAGFSVIQAIKEKPEISTICIIHTVRDNVENIVRAREAGITVFVYADEPPKDRGRQPPLAALIRRAIAGEHYFPLYLLDALVELNSNNKQELGGARFENEEFTNNSIELTKREKTVLRLAGEGHSNKSIAHELNISISTVKTHFDNIFDKFNIRNRHSVYVIAQKRGLLD